MIRLSYITLLSFFSIYMLTVYAHAGDPLAEEKKRVPPGAILVISLLEVCMKEELGGDDAFNNMVEMGRQAERQISSACRDKNIKKAHQIARYYASTREGKAAFACAAKVRPIVQDPFIQKLLGKHVATANTIMAGHVPENVCL